MTSRQLTPADRLLSVFDSALRTLFGRPQGSGRLNPADDLPEPELTDREREQGARLMRVNHSGEIAAQGLYQGQALTARRTAVRSQLERAATEENDHLLWCEERIRQLGGRTSFLNPLWYAGSVTIGALAGVVGDRWSLGFLGETERQVVRHLDSHLGRLPAKDRRSRTILAQMKQDEQRHATAAMNAGGAGLPPPIRRLMEAMARVMTRTAYWI